MQLREPLLLPVPGHLLDKCPWQTNGEVEMAEIQISVGERGP